jgi:hypothetical protein
MYKHAEHRPHRAANKYQQRENHPPHHLRRQEQPDLRHLQLLLPKKEDRERHEPPRLPFVEATSSLNLESWSFSSLAVWFRTFPAHWLDYDPVALAVLVIGIGMIELLALII